VTRNLRCRPSDLVTVSALKMADVVCARNYFRRKGTMTISGTFISFYETYDRRSLPSRIDTGRAVRLVYQRRPFA
jgi:hypothetical protein